MRQQKKKITHQIAGDFLNLDDAEFYSKMIEQDGAKEVKIVMK
jgi:hypothetical protein